jgi:hypothetical protein
MLKKIKFKTVLVFFAVVFSLNLFISSAHADQYRCPLNGSVYGSSSVCSSNCTQQANCSLNPISITGGAGGNINYSLNGSGDKLCFTISPDGGDSYNTSCLSLSGFSATGVGSFANVNPTLYGNGNKLCFGGTQGDSQQYGCLDLVGATASGTASGNVSVGFYGNGNKICASGEGYGCVTFTPDKYSCPFSGGSVCSGSPMSCSKTSNCEVICIDSSWSPSPSNVCSGSSFTQTSNCGRTRSVTGTSVPSFSPSPSTTCNGTSFLQTNGCYSQWATGTKTDGACCIDTSWSPSPSGTCVTSNLNQTSNCGRTRTVQGTKNNASCCTSWSAWSPGTGGTCSNTQLTQTRSCNNIGGLTQSQTVAGTYNPTTWTPSTSMVCSGQTFTQSNGCTTKSATGTSNPAFSPDPSTRCIGTTFLQTNGCTSKFLTGTKADASCCTSWTAWMPDSTSLCTSATVTQTRTCVNIPSLTQTQTVNGPIPAITAKCGSVSGTASTTLPTQAQMCSLGYPEPATLSGNAPWSWKCKGICGGATVDCGTSLPMDQGGWSEVNP